MNSVDALIEVICQSHEDLGWDEPPFTSEWRVFFSNGQPVAATRYPSGGSQVGLSVPNAIEDIKDEMGLDLTRIRPPKKFVPFYSGIQQLVQH